MLYVSDSILVKEINLEKMNVTYKVDSIISEGETVINQTDVTIESETKEEE